MGTAWLLLILFVGGALAISFLCSILEATLLSVRVTELAGRKRDGDRGAALLLDLKRNRLDESIGAILTLNTTAHTIGAAMAGAQAAIVFGETWVGVFSAVLTVLVLIVTEIIPKTLGTVFASALVGFVARTTLLLTRLLWPVLKITRAITALIARPVQPPVSRAELAALVGMAARQGTLQGEVSRVFDNVLRLDDVRVADIMTPRTVAVMLGAETTVAELLDHQEAAVFSRIPLFDENRDHIVGYVVQRDVLLAAARHPDRAKPLGAFRRDAWFLTETTPLSVAMREFLKHREQMALVTDEFGAVTGLVTLEDLMETILGVEIVDELDKVVDMRQLAAELRDGRLQRMRVPTK